MERMCEIAVSEFIIANTDKIRSIRVNSTGVYGDDSQPVKRTSEIYTKLCGITALEIFEAGFSAGAMIKEVHH